MALSYCLNDYLSGKLWEIISSTHLNYFLGAKFCEVSNKRCYISEVSVFQWFRSYTCGWIDAGEN